MVRILTKVYLPIALPAESGFFMAYAQLDKEIYRKETARRFSSHRGKSKSSTRVSSDKNSRYKSIKK